MKVGAVFPHQEIGHDPAVIRDWAQAAEELGYSHIIAYDHVLGASHENRQPRLYGPYTEKDAFHEPLVLFGFLAACTVEIGLATGILILPQRQTALVAKQVAEIDILSKGRMRLGVGTGWNYVEYDVLNEDFSTRGKRQVEQIDLLRRLWQEPLVNFEGQWHRVDRAGLNPLPRRSIPIWFGGFTEVALRRAAKIGDGFIFGGAQADNLVAAKKVRGYVADQGRELGTFGIEAFLNFQDGPDKWVEYTQAWQGIGADFIAMRATALTGVSEGLASPQAHISALEDFWQTVSEFVG